MIVGFRDAIRETSFLGKHARNVAMGLEWLDQTVNGSANQLEAIKREEKDMIRRAKEAIKEAGGQMNGETNAPTPDHKPEA